MEENTNIETQEVIEGQETKTYTQEEVDALLQSETDRRVTSALRKQAEKNEAKYKEAQKLAQMNETQKYEYELQQREAAIAEKERALILAENKNEASKILNEKGLSLSLVDFVVADDAETMNDNITLLEKAFKQSVKDEVEKRLSSNTPKKNLPMDDTVTKDRFRKMNIMEQQELARQNPSLYKELIGG